MEWVKHNRVKDSRDRSLRSQRASKSSRPGLSSETGQVKASGSPVVLACVTQRHRTSEVFW